MQKKIKAIIQLTGLFICVLSGCFSLQAQINPYVGLKREVIIESLNDSLTIASNFYGLGDLPDAMEAQFPEIYGEEETDLSIEVATTEALTIHAEEESDEEAAHFADMEDEYESFDTEIIHYPKVNFSTKQDTTYIYLCQHSPYIHPCKGIKTSSFGFRRYRYHYGTDIDVETGDPIYATFDGIVRVAKRNPSYGNLVIIRHYNGLETYYAHLSSLSVEPDQPVKAGDLIGKGGNTGRSRGSHLHFEVRYLGAPINPEDLIDFSNGSLLCDTLMLSSYHFRYLSDVVKQKQAQASAKYYTVKKGETLSSIARKNKTTVAAICKLNKIKSTTKIHPGRKLRVR